MHAWITCQNFVSHWVSDLGDSGWIVYMEGEWKYGMGGRCFPTVVSGLYL